MKSQSMFQTQPAYIYLDFIFSIQVKKTFREPNWWSHHDKWGNKRYDWLPTNNEIPKNLGERPTIAHLQDLEVCRNLTSRWLMCKNI